MSHEIEIARIRTGKIHRLFKDDKLWCQAGKKAVNPVRLTDTEISESDPARFCKMCFPSGKPRKYRRFTADKIRLTKIGRDKIRADLMRRLNLSRSQAVGISDGVIEHIYDLMNPDNDSITFLIPEKETIKEIPDGMIQNDYGAEIEFYNSSGTHGWEYAGITKEQIMGLRNGFTLPIFVNGHEYTVFLKMQEEA